ncbi:MAG: hypothetical protein JST08_08505 [Actinobacteria bacterium]|nr:hypothetical protein [Actinomycetota bacterium]
MSRRPEESGRSSPISEDTRVDVPPDDGGRTTARVGDGISARPDDAHATATGDETPSLVAAYERLAELAEAELAACEGERPEDLADLYAEAAAIRPPLPGRPPAAAEPALRRAAAAQERIGQLLGARLAERGNDLERVHRAREAAHAYATTARARAGA